MTLKNYFGIYSEFIFNQAADFLLCLHGTHASDFTSKIDLRWLCNPDKQQEDSAIR